jgi:CO/xanthine dehydrogenase FAD-binding subunit
MRSYVPAFQLVAPPTLETALETMSNEPGVWKPFAGGTDLMVLFESGKLNHTRFLSIWHFDELRGIEVTDDWVSIGALTTYTEIRSNPVICAEFPMLCKAAGETGGLAIQNRGTLGGNIVNASPAADSPPALLVYESVLELVSSQGTRHRPYVGFHTGYKQMDLQSGEILRAIKLPRKMDGWRQFYRKVGTRKAQAISKICFAGAARMDGARAAEIRIALGSVAPTVLRCPGAESALSGTTLDGPAANLAREALARDISPIDDIRSTARYRAMVAGNVLAEFLDLLRADENS